MPNQINITDKPQLYDWLYDDFSDDVKMYLSIADSYDTVLECGIGTGRVSIPLAKKRKKVVGIDNSPTMLEHLRRKLDDNYHELLDSIAIYHEDMRNFELNLKFPLILIPFSTFNYLLSIEDQKKSLESIKKHLEPKGRIVLELLSYSMYPAWFLNDSILRKYKEKVDYNTNQIVQLWKRAEFDSSTQMIKEERYFKFYNLQGELIKEELVYWENRFFFMGEITLLLERCGFQLVDVYGDFSYGAYNHKSQVAIIVAESIS